MKQNCFHVFDNLKVRKITCYLFALEVILIFSYSYHGFIKYREEKISNSSIKPHSSFTTKMYQISKAAFYT